MKRKILAIVGPTASGKSALGIYLAQKLGGEIISADSRQVYKGLDIATGKVTKKEMASVPHHLLSVASPKVQFTVDDFVRKARKAFSGIAHNGRTPIVVGGTGLYVDMLLGRMSYPHVPPNPKLRAQLEKKSAEQLYAMLLKLDPQRAKTIDARNPRRLVRAIEIAKGAGKFDTRSEKDAEETYDTLWIGLNPGEETLKKKIRTRTRARMKGGMVAEAKRLHDAGLSYKRMRELGLEYRFLADFLQKKLSLAELEAAVEKGNLDYAKRQMRWFKRNKDIHWVSGKTEALRLAKGFLAKPASSD